MSALTIAITGPSSSGKTSLSRLLKLLFNKALAPTSSTIIVHGDDFYVKDSDIPVRKLPPLKPGDEARELQDWDCPESMDFERLLSTLQYVKQHGAFPEDFKSFEDQDTSQQKELERVLGTELVKELEKNAVDRIRKCLDYVDAGGKGNETNAKQQRVVIMDGFLLLGKDVPEKVINEFDVKIFLRAPYEKAKSRREARQGYVTIEGYWTDPPGYFDDIVWPGYIAQHAYLFTNDDVERSRLTDEADKRKIISPFREDNSAQELSLEEVAKWAVEEVLRELEMKHPGSS